MQFSIGSLPVTKASLRYTYRLVTRAMIFLIQATPKLLKKTELLTILTGKNKNSYEHKGL